MKKILLIFSIALISISCTDNQIARTFGGTEEYKLQKNHKLIMCTWKEADLWVLTVDTTTGISYFNEKSTYGVLEGSIIFK